MEAPRAAARHDRGRDVRATYRPRHSRLHRRPRRPEGPLPPRTITSSLVHRPREDDRYLRQSDPRERPRRPAIERAEVGDDLGARQPGVHAHLRRAGRRARLQDRQSRASGGDRGRAPAAPTTGSAQGSHAWRGASPRVFDARLHLRTARHRNPARTTRRPSDRCLTTRRRGRCPDGRDRSLPRADRQGNPRRRAGKSAPRGSRLAGLRPARGPTRVQCSRRASPATPRASPRQAPAARRSPGRTTAPPRPWWSIEGTVIRRESLLRITSPCRPT